MGSCRSPFSSADTELLCPRALKYLIPQPSATGVINPISRVWTQTWELDDLLSYTQLGKAELGVTLRSSSPGLELCPLPRCLPGGARTTAFSLLNPGWLHSAVSTLFSLHSLESY